MGLRWIFEDLRRNSRVLPPKLTGTLSTGRRPRGVLMRSRLMKKLNISESPAPLGLLVCLSLCAGLTQAFGDRAVIPLDGQWQIAEGKMSSAPTQFERHVPVPGLVDEARPTFAEVGQKSPRREAFWYRRTFQFKGEVPAVAVLKIHKAAYGSARVPERRPPGRALAQLHARLLRCPASLARQWGCERTRRSCRRLARSRAAYRCLGLGLRESPLHPGHIRLGRTDSVRDAKHRPGPSRARDCQPIHSRAGGGAECRPAAPPRNCASRCARRAPERPPARAARSRSHSTATPSKLWRCGYRSGHCRLWSPEDPFLYELETSTGADTSRTRFGMREFRLDHETGPRDAQRPPVFPARQQRDALPVLRGPAVRRPSLAGRLGAAAASRLQGHALERAALLHRVPARALVSHRRRGRHPDPGRVPHLGRRAKLASRADQRRADPGIH